MVQREKGAEVIARKTDQGQGRKDFMTHWGVQA